MIQNDVPVSGISLTNNQQKFYKIDVPAGATDLWFSTSGGSGDTDLYMQLGSRPTATNFQCKSDGPTTSETCTIASPQVGRYYVLLHGYAASSGVTLAASYTR